MNTSDLGDPKSPLSFSELKIEKYSKLLLAINLLAPWPLSLIFFGRFFYRDLVGFFDTLGLQANNASAMLLCLFLFCITRPSWFTLRIILLVGLIFEAFYFLWLPYDFDWLARLWLFGGGIGLGGLVGLIYLALFETLETRRRRARIYTRVALIFLTYPFIAGVCLAIISALTPLVYDANGFIVEGGFGAPDQVLPAHLIATFILQLKSIYPIHLAIYHRLLVWVALAITICFLSQKTIHFDLVSAYVVAGFLVLPFYFLLPMVGLVVFIGSDFSLITLPEITEPGPIQAPIVYPRTCFPSMHLTWVLLPYFAVSKISRAWRVIYAFLVFGTAIAAVGPVVGHYFIDMVAGVPFALLVVSLLCYRSPGNLSLRVLCGVYGFSATFAIGAAIRWFPLETAAHGRWFWAVAVGSAVVALILEELLSRRTIGPTPKPISDISDS